MYSTYVTLDKFFNLQYGKILLAISGADDITSMLDSELPFFANYKEVVEVCLRGESCQELQSVLESLG